MNSSMVALVAIQLLVLAIVPGTADCQAQAWLDYLTYTNQSAGVPLLPDFSWAGYKFSNEPIPYVVGPVFNVVEQFGAVNDGSAYCDEQVQKAIDAAARAGGGVVYFPAGDYLMGQAGSGPVLRIRSNNIVLRGEGSHAGGTRLYMQDARLNNALISVEGYFGRHLTNVLGPAQEGSLQLRVANAAMLNDVPCFMVDSQDTSYNDVYYGEATLQSGWTELISKGSYIHEAHCVESVDCDNKVVTMTEPLKTFLPGDSKPFSLVAYYPVRHIGIESLRVQGAWGSYPGTFCHHCSDVDDVGWTAIQTSAVRDMWVRDCVFEDLVRSIMLTRTQATTVQSCTVMGKMGHFSFQSKRGYGNLFMDTMDLSGAHHGPSVEASDVGTVYLRHSMRPGQYIDMHAFNPRQTLLDNVVGGILSGNGGSLDRYPHHADKLVVWNFQSKGAGRAHYSFWTNASNAQRSQHTFLRPIVVGVTGDQVTIDEDTCLHLEGLGETVQPQSLFEAQLQRRLVGDYGPSAEYPICVQGCGSCDLPELTAGRNVVLIVCLVVALLILLGALLYLVARCRRKRRVHAHKRMLSVVSTSTEAARIPQGA